MRIVHGSTASVSVAVLVLLLAAPPLVHAEDWKDTSFRGQALILDPAKTGAPERVSCTLEVVGRGFDPQGRAEVLGRLQCPSKGTRYTAEILGSLEGCGNLRDPEIQRWSWSSLGFPQGSSAKVRARPDGALALELSSPKIRGCSVELVLPAVQKVAPPPRGGVAQGATDWATRQSDGSNVSLRTDLELPDGRSFTAEILPLGRGFRLEVRLFGADGKLWKKVPVEIKGASTDRQGGVDENTVFRWEVLGFGAQSPVSVQEIPQGVKVQTRSTKNPVITLEYIVPTT